MSRTDFSTSTPPCSHPAEAFALDRLMSPPGRFADPFEILRDDALAQDEKRAILSSWASDACAVDSAPALRQPPGARRPIPIDAIMDALQRLDLGGTPDRAAVEAMGRHGQRLDN